MDIQDPMQLSLQDCQHEHKLSVKSFSKEKCTTVFLHDLASQQAAKGNEMMTNIILRMHQNDELRNSYRRIKNATKPFCGATDKVLTNIVNEKMKKYCQMKKTSLRKHYMKKTNKNS